MTDLRILDFKGCQESRTCPGVGEVIGLEVLVLSGCNQLEELPSLQKLIKLRILDISYCGPLKALPGLGSLVSLQELLAFNCDNLEVVSDLSRLSNLQVLRLDYCDSLEYVPGLGNLIALRDFIGSGQLLEAGPDHGNLTNLHTVMIREWEGKQLSASARQKEDEPSSQELQPVLNLAVLESVKLQLGLSGVQQELTNLGKLTRLQDLLLVRFCGFKTQSGLSNLTALKCLNLYRCILERLPDMGKDMRLESLGIERCWGLRGWDGVGRLRSSELETGVHLQCQWTLPHLDVLQWKESAVVELPDLSHFPRLRKLVLDHFYSVARPSSSPDGSPSSSPDFALHCLANHLQLEIRHCDSSPVTELPDLSKFPSLKKLKLWHCHKLTSLSISGPLTALEVLELKYCRSLKALPDVDLLPRLRECRIEENPAAWNAQEIEELKGRCLQLRVDAESWELNPGSSRTEIIPNIEVPNCNTGMHASRVPNDLLSGSSSLGVEPSSSEFIPYNEPNSELGIVPVPKRARRTKRPS